MAIDPFSIMALLAKLGSMGKAAVGLGGGSGIGAAATAAGATVPTSLAATPIGKGALAAGIPNANLTLSEGLKGAAGAVNFARKLIPGKGPQNTLALLEMGLSAGSNVKDPKELFKAIGEPMEALTKNIMSEGDKNKRLSDIIPPPLPMSQRPPSAPAPSSAAGAMSNLPPTSLMPRDDRLRRMSGF